MSSIRIKVQLGDNKSSNRSYRKTLPSSLKFVYVLNSTSTKTINELRHLLEKYVIRQFSYSNIQIVQLMTDDGYFLSNDDICSDVLEDNDRIICVDMEKFVEENYSTLDLENLWCEIKQHDASDNLEKYIQIGLNNFGKLFIRIHGTSTMYGLYMFNIFELIQIANEKKQQNNIIARFGNTNWFIEVKWEYDSVSNTCLFLICSLKISSNEQIWSNKLHILLDEVRMCIEKGEIIYMSGETNDDDILSEQQRECLKELASNIPLPKRIGPEIDINRDRNKKITKYDCEGESLIRMTYGSTNTVTAYQDLRSSEDGTFCQYFTITHITFSKKLSNLSDVLYQEHKESTDKHISVVNLTVFYRTNDGSWHECEDVAIGPIALRNEEPRWLADSIINIESDKVLSYAIKGCLHVKGEPGRDNATRKRIHKSLPQPFQLKIIITDNFNKQCSLIVEQLNKFLEFDTAESFVKYNQTSIKEFLAFVYADDCEYDERIFMAIYLNTENQLVIKSGHMYSIILERKNIRTMEFNAKQNQTTEVLFDSIYYQSGKQEKKAIALFDSQTYMFYAIRLEISTNTSKTEETVILPLEKIK
ncbi:unnamed protein product [Rotaria sp. Silwood1]|nr:unnamed protein product [Rotaria sp. Silwood1]CAF1623675.1 unnamed protein product [Rotaria sp. Silwood1]CAF3741012.1 unnamed protein product [Rotaria sp. Silwood1]CAF3849838.1 unnamed protein product [Rotaria sp. Silwood1]CAF4749650.1 unnamed protein product [Rotaria sp. Silwood1]